MNCDHLIDALADAGSPGDLPAEARLHLDACDGCAGVARALELLSAHPEVAAPAPPAGYWDDFDARLAARLKGGDSVVVPLRRRSPVPLGLARLAAALVLVAAGWSALRVARDASDPIGGSAELTLAAAAAPEALLEEAQALTAAWPEAWPEQRDAWSLATASDSDDWEDLLEDPFAPLDAVGDELAGQLTDEQAAELARRLRQEISS